MLQFPILDGMGFQVQKIIMTNLKVKKKIHILARAFFTRTTHVFCLPIFLQILTVTADNIGFSQVHHLLTLKRDSNKQNV